MNPSWQIARIYGIPIKLHWTMLFLLPAAFLLYDMPGLGQGGLLFFAGVFLIVTACVILHELGHALVARYYGISTDDIILSPLFGVARLKKLPDSALGEFAVAFAGPVVNMLMALIVWAILHWGSEGFLSTFSMELWDNLRFGPDRLREKVDFSPGYMLLGVAFWVNTGLAGFNLIPAFPMDGGRMFRALLHRFTDKLTATRIASLLAKAIAWALIGAALVFHQYFLVLLGLFIFYMAGMEYQSVRGQLFRSQFCAADMLRKSYTALDDFTTARQVRDLLLHGSEQHFLVFSHHTGELLGLLLKEDAIQWIMGGGSAASDGILPHLTKDFPILEPALPLEEVLEIMREKNLPFLPVAEGGELPVLGVMDSRSIYGFMDIRRRLYDAG